jgi:beta-phosphoglucomutase
MDGTLVDSGDFHFRSWRNALAAEGFDLSFAQFTQTFGQRNDTILRTLLRPDLPDSEIERIGGSKEAEYRDLVRAHGIVVLPGVREWLTRLQQDGWLQAVASSAPRANIDTILAVLDLGAFFDVIVAAEDVVVGKPDPQVFLTGAARLGVEPRWSIVVEDAPAGVEGARRAGMRCIGIVSAGRELNADLVVERLDSLPTDAFERLVAPEP